MAVLSAEEKAQRNRDTAALLAKINEVTGTRNTAQTMQTEFFKKAGVNIGINSKTNAVTIDGKSVKDYQYRKEPLGAESSTNLRKTDMQKKKEDRAEEKWKVDSLHTKKAQAEKALADFDQKAEYDATSAHDRQRWNAEREQLQKAVDQAGAELKSHEETAHRQHDREIIRTMDQEDRKSLEQYAVNQVRDQNLPIELAGMMPTAEQEAVGFTDKFGKQRAKEMAETFMREENAKLAEQAEGAGRKFAEGLPGWASAATVPINLMSGIVDTVGQLQGAARATGRYRSLDANETGTALDKFSGAVRGQVAQDISGDVYDQNGNQVKDGGILRQLGSYAYQGGMSFIDSTARMLATGGSSGISSAIAGLGAFSQGLQKYSAMGASPQQAALAATASAGLEYITEKLPTEQVLKIFHKGGGISAVKEVLEQAFLVEPLGEEVNLFAGIAAEALILGEKSGKAQRIGDLIAGGMSKAEAEKQFWKETFQEAAETYAVSAVAGGLGAGGAAYAGNLATNNAPEVTAEVPQEVPTEVAPAAPVVEEGQQIVDAVTAEPSMAPLFDGIQDMTPAPEPLTQEQQQLNAAASMTLNEVPGKMNDAENATADKTEAVAYKMSPPEAQADTRTDVQQRATERVTNPTEFAQTVGSEPGIKGTGAAEQNFTGTAAYDNLLTDDNVQRERKGDVRSVEVPITDAEGRKVSEAAGNIMNSEWTPDTVTDTIKKMVMEGGASHDVMSNEAALKNAANAIKNEGGAYNSLQAIKEQASKGWTSPEAVAKAELIYHHFANEVARMEESGGADEITKNLASDAFVTLAQLATNSGQSTQLFSVFRRMTPELQVKTLEKNVQRYVDEINKERRAGKRAAVNAEAQKAQKPVSDAVKKARKETGSAATKAADKIRFKGNKVKIDADKYSEPFVFEYAQKVGEALAKGLENSQKKKPAKTFLQTMTSELRKFAAEKMPAAQKERQLTPTELLRDYIQNQDFYAEAWSAAQETLRAKHANDPAYQEFINSGIGVDANANPQNRIMAKALAAAAMETGETTEMLRKQQALGITGMSENIANKLIRDTGATGEMAQTIRDAAYEFVKTRINEGDGKETAKTYDANYFVNEAMRDIKQSMADVAKRNTQGRETAKQAVIKSLTRKYNIGLTDAQNIAEVVGDTFDQKAQERARKILEQKFGEREKKQPKSAGQMIEEYANLGAYGTESQYSEQATESFLRAAMKDIGVTVSELAKSGNENKEAVRTKISQMITERHGINKADADHIAEVVGDQLAAMTQEKAKRILEQRFAERPKSEKKTAMQMLSEYANLGAFDVGSEFNESATSKIVGDKYSTTLREDLVQNFLNAKTDDAKAKAMDEIYKDVASKIAPTLEESWDAWRNLAMMFNAKTHERNFISTGAFKPYAIIKRNVAAVIESAFVDKQNRTRGMLGIGKKSVDLLKWAQADANSAKVTEAFENYGKGGNEAARKIQEYRQMMWKPLDKLGKFNMNLMEKEDLVWKRNEYAASLASFLKSRGYTAEQAAKGQIPDAIMNEARQLAINDAAKATFTDRNRFSDAIAKFRVKGDDPVSKSINALAKGVLPYARTPANIVVRVKEYSPIEIARGFNTLATKVKTGEATVAQGIDQIASGLTGTGMMILGAALRDGLIPGVKLIGRAEEEEKREGAQDYSVKIGDQYYGIGFLAPACIPLFIGAELGKAFPSWSDFWESSAFDKADALATIGASTLDPMLELSVMSSLNNIVDTYNSAETSGEGVIAALITAATSYFTQGLPTIIGQAEQATETVKTSAYVNTDNPTEKTIKSIVSNATQRIPGVDLYRTTKLDEWGQPVTNEGSPLERAMAAMFSPFSVTEVKDDAITKEITRLNRAGYNVTPNTAARTVSYIDKDGTGHDDVRLTEEQFQKLAETQGKTARKLLDDMISSASYAALTDEQKADAIDTAYLYARKTGEIAAIDDHTGYDQSWFYDVEKGGAEEIVRRVLNSGLNTSMSDLDTAWDRGYNEETFNRELQTAYESYSNAPADMRKQVYAEAEGTAKKYIEARDKGVSHEDFVAAAENIAKVKGTGSINKDTGKATVRDIDRRQAIANTSGMTPHEIDIVMKAYMADYDPSDESPETTEMKYDYIRHEMGMSAKEYAATYRAYLDSSKKAQRIAAIRALGYDYGTALKLYKVYSGSMKKKLIDMYG